MSPFAICPPDSGCEVCYPPKKGGASVVIWTLGVALAITLAFFLI
jgi:hypothetical protein